jgi:hypothetical protein
MPAIINKLFSTEVLSFRRVTSKKLKIAIHYCDRRLAWN